MSRNDSATVLDTEIPSLSDGYQGIRKAYGLCSALLVGWELIGIEFDASPVENLNVSFQSPQAAPYVLVALMLYFSFRLTVEWFQSNSRRRKMPASRVDFAVAHSIAASALLLYAVQSALKAQLADKLSAYLVSSFIFGLVFAGVIFGFLNVRADFRKILLSTDKELISHPLRVADTLSVVFVALVSSPVWLLCGSVWYLARKPDEGSVAFISIALGLAAGILYLFSARFLHRVSPAEGAQFSPITSGELDGQPSAAQDG